jgi:hypothetical protein
MVKNVFYDGGKSIKNGWLAIFFLTLVFLPLGLEIAMLEAGFYFSAFFVPFGIGCLIWVTFLEKYETGAKVRVRRNNHRQKMIGPKLASTPKRKARMS